MGNEKLTGKRILAIIGLTAIACVGLTALYLIILLFSSFFTGHGFLSWVLSFSITMAIPLSLLVYWLKTREKRGNCMHEKLKRNAETICAVFLLVFGATFVFLGLINWLRLWGMYMLGLMSMLWSLSYTRLRVHAKYIIPTLLTIGATLAILGWHLVPTIQMIPPPANPYVRPRILAMSTGMGVFSGGIVSLATGIKRGTQK